MAVVRTLSRPIETRAGDDSTLIQNETQDRITIRIDGTKTWMRKNPISRRRMNRISWHGNAPAEYTMASTISSAIRQLRMKVLLDSELRLLGHCISGPYL